MAARSATVRRTDTDADKMEREAVHMEVKLGELRAAMLRERERRESMKAKNGGSIWASGQAQGRLRGHKGTNGVKPKAVSQKIVKQTPSTSDPPKLANTRNESESSSSPSQDPIPSEKSGFKAQENRFNAEQIAEINSADMWCLPSMSGGMGASRGISPSTKLLSTQLPAGKPKPINHQPPPRETNNLNSVNGDRPVEGDFNEEESHASFLAALAEWRGVSVAEVVPDSAASTGQSETQKDRMKAVYTMQMDCQTEAPAGSRSTRPQSAKNSYFEHLLLAKAAEPSKLNLFREGSSSSNQVATALPDQCETNDDTDSEIDPVEAFPEFFPEYQ